MSDRWQLVCVGDLAEVFDGPHATPTKTEYGPWYLSISSLKNGKVDLSESAHLSDEDFPIWTRRVQPEPGDTLFSYETRLGEAGHWSSQEQAALGRRMGLLRPRRERVDPRFLTYAYIGPQFQTEIRRRSIHGATVDRIPIAEIGQWPIAVPPLNEQRQIAWILSTFDDLIDTNYSLISALDSLFHAEWQRRYLALQGPNASLRLSELCDTQYGYTESATKEASGPRFLRVADINKNNWIDWASVPFCPISPDAHERYRLRRNDLVVARMADPGKAAIVDDEVDAVFASYLVRLIPKRGELTRFLYGLLKSPYYAEYAASVMTGSVQKNMNAKVITGCRVELAPDQSLREFDAFGEVLRSMIGELVRERAELSRGRDELLPLLLSGQVRVEDEAV